VALEGRPEDYTARLGEMISGRRVGVSILDEEGEGEIGNQDLLTATDQHYHHDGC
jgi:urease accessory protein